MCETVNQFGTFVYFYQKNYHGLFQKCQRGKLNEPQKLKIHEKIQNSIFFPIFNPLCFKPNKLLKKENLLIFDQKNLGSVFDIFKSEDING